MSDGMVYSRMSMLQETFAILHWKLFGVCLLQANIHIWCYCMQCIHAAAGHKAASIIGFSCSSLNAQYSCCHFLALEECSPLCVHQYNMLLPECCSQLPAGLVTPLAVTRSYSTHHTNKPGWSHAWVLQGPEGSAVVSLNTCCS